MNHLNQKQVFDVYSHRRKAMGESTLFIAAGYASTQIATVIAKNIGLTSIHYSVIGMIIGIVFTVTVVIYIISQIRKYPSKTFANLLFFIQTAVWGIMYAVWIFNLNEIRTSTLFFALMAIILMASNTSFYQSLFITLATCTLQVGITYYAIYYGHQSGSFNLEMFYIACFLPSALFLAFLSRRLTLQRKSISSAQKNAEHARDDLDAELLRAKKVQDMVSGKLKNISGELFTNAETVAKNSQNQAASIEEITSAIEEVGAGIDSSTTMAGDQEKRTAELIEKLKEMFSLIEKSGKQLAEAVNFQSKLNKKIDESGEEVSRCQKAMGSALSSSNRVSEAITIINDISDQINLLSLNASIEAARAGEYGRGFAVVAEEIGKLADKTQANTKEIIHLVEATNTEMKQTSQSLSIVTAASKGINEIANQFGLLIKEVSGLSQRDLEINRSVQDNAGSVLSGSIELKVAMDEVKIAIDEISQSVASINESTQQIATGSMSLSATANGLVESTEQLNTMIISAE